MKRILARFLSAALLLALLCACSAGDPETTVIPSDSAGESASVPPADDTQEPSLALPSEEPTEEPSDEPSDEPSQEPSQAPATQAPATRPPAPQPPAPTHHPENTHHPEETHHPDPSPTVPGGGVIMPGPGGGTQEPSEDPNGFTEPTGPSASDVNLSSFCNSVIGSYTFPAMTALSTDWIAESYPGLASIPAVQRVVYVVSASSDAAEIVLVQVTNSSDVSTVESILQTRIASQVNGGAYYLPAIEQWELNSRIKSNGDYIMLVVHSSCDAIVADFNALF